MGLPFMVTFRRQWSTSTTTTNDTAARLVTAILGIAASLVEIFAPFVTLVLWQASFGLFAYFYPVEVEQFVTYTHVPWLLLGIFCALIRMASREFFSGRK